MSVLVSAIIPVYNSEEFLEECIVSLINQTLKNIEIIVVNDGSSDKSLEILKKYEKIDSRLIIIDQKNNGPSAARNRGIEIASGEYLSFVDSDDWIDLRMYEEMYSRAKSTEADIVICDMKMTGVNSDLYIKGISFDIKSYSKKEFKSNIYNELLSNSQFNSMANKIYKTKIVKENNIFLDENIYYAEDWLFNMQTIIHTSNIEYINKQFYYYRRGHESSSSFYDENTFERTGIWIYRKRKKYADLLNKNKFLGVNDLFQVTISCIVNEFRRNDIHLNKKIKRVREIINIEESKEMIENINLYSLSNKEKFLYFNIKNKLILFLFIYVLLGKIKENLRK